MAKQTDNEIIERALKGDQSAYAKLMNRYRDNIYYYVLKMIGNQTIAGDITLDTFSKAFNQINDYNNNFAFSTWLYRIARNCTIDFVRKRKVNTLHIDYDSNEEAVVNESTLDSYTPDPEQTLIREQEDAVVKKLIESLSPKYRKLIELRYFNEFAYEEIAKELDMPINTVKTRLFRAKNILAERILKSAKFNSLQEGE